MFATMNYSVIQMLMELDHLIPMLSRETIARPDTNVHIHGRLEYHRYYFYRVRTVNTFGIASDGWAYFTQDGILPAQTGNEDLAANSVYALNLYANAVQALHISADAVQAHI